MLAMALLALMAQEPPPRASDVITVTATRSAERLGNTAASVVVLPATAIAQSAAATVDDMLRQVPGFTLFRRAGSRTANPTTQGASLRAIGGSGASRALVLDDGITLNDPFGGWVFWGRIPRAALQRVEVVRGGASDVYGSGAMGGVVQFIRRRDDAALDMEGGSERTASTSLFLPFRSGAWSGSVAADLFTTGGYVLVDADQRGAVDRAASSRHAVIDATIRRGDLFLRASRFDESRNNGTPLQVNDTTIHQIAAGFDRGPWSMRIDRSENQYHQTFSAITANRATERLTVDQHVPSHSTAASLQWTRPLRGRHFLIAGAEGREVGGTDDEPPARASGHQRTAAFYVEDVAQIGSRANLTAAVRGDSWRNYSAARNGLALADRSDTALSPRVSFLFRSSDRLSLTASAYRAFRAPTLNELYRSFRVGNVLTLANESLGAERLSGFEIGARSGPVRVTLFDMTITDTVANVTLSTTPALITRQRQNLGSSRSRGAEVDWSRTVGSWSLGGGYLFADAALSTGRRTPQVARQQAALQVAWRGLAGVQTRWSARQFDDDLNQFPLRGFFVADLFASHPLAPRIDATLSVENVLNRRVETAATPVINLGQPRALRIGLRYGFRR